MTARVAQDPFVRCGDIDTEAAVEEMVRCFYRAVAQDDLLGPVFNDVAHVDWAEHLPRLTAFWCRVLFGTPGYEGNAILAHARIHERHRFTDEHFRRWLDIFDETIGLGWAGPYCDKAISFAHHVARSHARRLGAL
ncbi:MAG: group III truncated hemoglobin [Acidimicrobiales bacterium]